MRGLYATMSSSISLIIFLALCVTTAFAKGAKREDYTTILETWTTTNSAGSTYTETSTLSLAVLSDPWIPITTDSTSHSLPYSTTSAASSGTETTGTVATSTDSTTETTASSESTGTALASSSSGSGSSSTSATSTAGAPDPTSGQKALTAAVAAAALGIAGIMAF